MSRALLLSLFAFQDLHAVNIRGRAIDLYRSSLDANLVITLEDPIVVDTENAIHRGGYFSLELLTQTQISGTLPHHFVQKLALNERMLNCDYAVLGYVHIGGWTMSSRLLDVDADTKLTHLPTLD